MLSYLLSPNHILLTSLCISYLLYDHTCMAFTPFLKENPLRSSSSLRHLIMFASLSTTEPNNLSDAKDLISRAISRGAPAYNSGDKEKCAQIYEETAKTIAPLLPLQLRNNLQEVCSSSSKQPDNLDYDAKAWALRRQFDAILEYEPPVAVSNPDNLGEAKGLISRAISRGAPAYNSGNIAECVRIYSETAKTIEPLLPTTLRNNLQQASSSDKFDSLKDDDKAWVLRRQFDSILSYEPPALPTVVPNNIQLEPFSIRQLPQQPIEVMDGVMGGISRGKWDPSTKTFSGVTSLANNGGFASLRWRFPTTQNWSYAKGIYLKVKHSKPSQHTFRLILKDATCERVRLANFKVVFANTNNSQDPILLPFTMFDQMEQMGNPMRGAPRFNPSSVTEMGIMAIKPTVIGDFDITIIDWGLYS